jgi:hypothetical protein
VGLHHRSFGVARLDVLYPFAGDALEIDPSAVVARRRTHQEAQPHQIRLWVPPQVQNMPAHSSRRRAFNGAVPGGICSMTRLAEARGWAGVGVADAALRSSGT